jgi:hypothetical protein
MDHPSDASSSNTLQTSIEKLFGLSSLATTLSLQLKEVTSSLVEAIQEPIKVPDDFSIMGRMTTEELMRMSNIEYLRANLMENWKRLETEKRPDCQSGQSQDRSAGR